MLRLYFFNLLWHTNTHIFYIIFNIDFMDLVLYLFVYFVAALKAKTKLVKKVPKGTSEYQAAWIVDSEEEEVYPG